MEEKVTHDIEDYCNDLLDIYFRLLPYRTLIFNRIRMLVQ